MANSVNENKPLRALGLDNFNQNSFFGLVMARAGLGKTAILVQFALDCMLQGNNLLHVSIGEGVDKTRSWYDDLLRSITGGEELKDIPGIMKRRMIMTFKESAFSKGLLAERLDDLVAQEIFSPECMVIDGYSFEESSRADFEALLDYLKGRGLKMVWFSAVSHRGDDRRSAAGVPAPCHELEDLFENILIISPEESEIRLETLKCDSSREKAGVSLTLDPASMLITNG